MLPEDMDSDASKIPGLALPNPPQEGGVRSSSPPLQPAGGPQEVMMPQVEVTPSNAGQLSPSSLPTNNMPPQPPMPPVATAADDNDSDDLDLEWVNKAKAIVEQTKNDPHRESSELSRVKADYLRIRYNKNIKIAEEQSR